MRKDDLPHPAFAALLADPRSALRPPREGIPLIEYRRKLDAPMTSTRGPELFSVDTLEPEITGCRSLLRVYLPAPAVRGSVAFIHGGGFVIGSIDTHDAMCRTLAQRTGARVVSINYRLAPEAPFPAALEDCIESLAWADRTQPTPSGALAICGDSAGGHLAVVTALRAARSDLPISALGLLYPVVDPGCSTHSWTCFGDGLVLTRDWMQWAWSAYIGTAEPSEPEISLLRADLKRLPPTHVIVAGCDPLCDEGELLGAAILASGGNATVARAPGMIHGFASLPALTREADEALLSLAEFFRQHMC